MRRGVAGGPSLVALTQVSTTVLVLGAGRASGAAPAVARRVDDHADARREPAETSLEYMSAVYDCFVHVGVVLVEGRGWPLAVFTRRAAVMNCSCSGVISAVSVMKPIDAGPCGRRGSGQPWQTQPTAGPRVGRTA